MKKNILYIFMMLLALSAAFSCDDAPDHFHYDGLNGPHSLIVSGIVSDKDSELPLEGIKIHFGAYPKGHTETEAIIEKNIYTDNKGKFKIEADGFGDMITCILNASDTDRVYQEAEQVINITWEGVSYDMSSETFVVNAEEFKLEKVK